jgi:fructan beta-fructosidase
MRISLIAIVLLLVAKTVLSQSNTYKEPHRPQFHFSQPANWMNDPNGLAYYNKNYHLFYQYYPDSTVWGPMHWGHAISKDLVKWKHLPIALYPDSLGLIFSGSVVVDANNTSGFKTGKQSPLVAIYTYHHLQREKAGLDKYQYQGIAFSNDGGFTWQKYKNNPVLLNNGEKDFRDPKVFWHQPTQHWIMTLAVGNKVQFYKSTNLKNWVFSSEFGIKDGNHGGVWECPDLIAMPVQNSNDTAWVLLVSIGNGGTNGGSATQYFVGNFDGQQFTNTNEPSKTLWVDNGTDNYAGVTYNNAPNRDPIFIGWMSNWRYAQKVPTFPWRSAMTMPRNMQILNTSLGLRLASNPIKRLDHIKHKQVKLTENKIEKFPNAIGEIVLNYNLESTTANKMGITIFNSSNEKIIIGFNKITNQVFIDRTNAGIHNFENDFAANIVAKRNATNTILKLRILIDKSSAEVFADDGTTIITATFFPSTEFDKIELLQQEGNAKPINAFLYPMKSIWK